MRRVYRLGNPMRIPMIKRIVGRAAFGYKMSNKPTAIEAIICLLYTSDAADEL